MAFKDEIDATDNQYRIDAHNKILDICIDKIDELEHRLETLSRLSKDLHYQPELINIPPDPPELIPGLPEYVLKDMVEVFKMNVAQKKRELELEKEE